MCWPEKPLSIEAKFRNIAGFPVLVNPPSGDEDAYINRHHTKSLNAAMVSGPDYKIYFCSRRCPGRWHDSRVLKESTLWDAFEEHGRRPFPGAVILGDSAYPCNDWLIPPFRGDVQLQVAQCRFNEAHKKSRSIIERAYGVIEKRFYSLQTGRRVRSMTTAAEIVQCAVVLHKICILFNDDGADVLQNDDLHVEDYGELMEHEEEQEGRRQQLQQYFL